MIHFNQENGYCEYATCLVEDDPDAYCAEMYDDDPLYVCHDNSYTDNAGNVIPYGYCSRMSCVDDDECVTALGDGYWCDSDSYYWDYYYECRDGCTSDSDCSEYNEFCDTDSGKCIWS